MSRMRRHPTRPPWAVDGQKTIKEPRRELRTRPGPLILFLIYVIVGGIIGIAINNRFYAMERAEMNAPKAE
jgi:hypothetical protein